MTASRKILKVKKYSEDLKIRDECTIRLQITFQHRQFAHIDHTG